MAGNDRDYQTADLTIHWRPALCEKCGACHQGLPQVFKPEDRPWIQPENASTEELVNQIDACPTQAISYTLK